MGSSEWIWLIECVLGYFKDSGFDFKRSELLYFFIQN